jgi:hypothetical protein
MQSISNLLIKLIGRLQLRHRSDCDAQQPKHHFKTQHGQHKQLAIAVQGPAEQQDHTAHLLRHEARRAGQARQRSVEQNHAHLVSRSDQKRRQVPAADRGERQVPAHFQPVRHLASLQLVLL